jgi:hypothetical protein
MDFIPYNRAALITTSDTVDLAQLTDAIYVGGAGAIVAVWQDGSTSTFSAVPVGTTLHIRCKRVNASSTTATLLQALYRT